MKPMTTDSGAVMDLSNLLFQTSPAEGRTPMLDDAWGWRYILDYARHLSEGNGVRVTCNAPTITPT